MSDIVRYSDQYYNYQSPVYRQSIDYRLELFRNSYLHNLLQHFIDVFAKHKVFSAKKRDKPAELFVQWLMERISEKDINDQEPVIPTPPLRENHDESIRETLEDINSMLKKNSNEKTINIDLVINELHLDEWCEKTYKRIEQWKQKNTQRSYHAKVVTKIDYEKRNVLIRIDTEMVGIGMKMFQRMRKLFMANASVSGMLMDDDIEKIIDYRIFIVNLRHQGVSPLKIREGGWMLDFFRDMKTNLDSEFELFASSLNSFSKNFCSMFPDIEQVFGSKGNLFHMTFTRGFYQSNPPSNNTVQLKTIDHHIEQLKNSNEPLAFMIFVKPYEYNKEENEKYSSKFDGVKRMRESGFILFEGNPLNKTVETYHHLSDSIRPYTAPAFIVIANAAGKKLYPIGAIQDLYRKHYI